MLYSSMSSHQIVAFGHGFIFDILPICAQYCLIIEHQRHVDIRYPFRDCHPSFDYGLDISPIPCHPQLQDEANDSWLHHPFIHSKPTLTFATSLSIFAVVFMKYL